MVVATRTANLRPWLRFNSLNVKMRKKVFSVLPSSASLTLALKLQRRRMTADMVVGFEFNGLRGLVLGARDSNSELKT